CPIISELRANVAKQTLELRWLVNDTAVDTYEIQVGRTENFTTNVSSSTVSSDSVLTWSWVSTLPLQCADHSVRIRSFCNHSNPSDWTQWKTNYGEVWKHTTMFPKQQVLKEGSTILFCCVPPRGVHITNMAFNSTSYPLINITHRVRAINVHNLNITQASVGCVDLGPQKTRWTNTISPQRPENLTCSTEDLRAITCTWTPGRPHDDNTQLHFPLLCLYRNSSQRPIKCGESSCRLQAVPGLEHYQVSVVVRNQLGEERQRYSFNITDRVFPVPVDVRVSPGVDKADVSWVLRGNLSGLGIFCQVTADQVKSRRQAWCAVLGKRTKRESGRNPCFLLHVSLVIVEWSSWVIGGFLSLFLLLYADPLVTLDVWRRIVELSHDRRKVTLLWTSQISGSASTVRIQYYQVLWSQNGGQWIQQRVREQTQTEIAIGPGQCDIIIQAVIRTGSSLPAHITIPPVERDGSHRIVMLMAGSADGGFHLLWEEQEDVTCGYTVEWCALGNGVPCNLQWRRVPVGKTWVSLRAGYFKPGRRYNFDIYGCTDEGDKLLAICTGYSQELNNVSLPYLIEPIIMSSTSVTLDWDYDENNPSNPGFITGYLVTVHKVSSTGPFNKTVADPHNKSLTIVGLQDNQEYTFHLSALTKVGPGPRTTVTYFMLCLVTDSTLLATPLFLLLGLFILLWPFCKK
uniref:Fibronectin type-III domain-containing protein n=1 Tax=Esox lucius TaxID=8010 RepID=A0A3P8XX68_ESOLU